MTLAPSTAATGTDRLAGLRVMIVEDESLVAMLLEDLLADLGCAVVGSFMRVGPAQDFIAKTPAAVDLAILDVNVAGERSLPLAERLSSENTPFLFSTGYDEGGIDTRWQGTPLLHKPFTPDDLKACLIQALDRRN